MFRIDGICQFIISTWVKNSMSYLIIYKKIMHWIFQQMQLHLKDLHGQKRCKFMKKTPYREAVSTCR